MQRSFDPELLRTAIAPYPDLNPEGYDWDEWIKDTNNVVLEDSGSIGVFSYEYPGLYTGHYFFLVKGRKAISLANEMLAEAFNEYGAKAIRGLTRTSNRPALWITRHLGFKSYGKMVSENGEHEIFCMTKDEFEMRNK
jgi:hypothetical protein